MQKGQSQEMATNEKRKRQQMKFLVQIEIEIDQYYLDRETNLLDFLNVAECFDSIFLNTAKGKKGRKKKILKISNLYANYYELNLSGAKTSFSQYTMCRKHFIIAI